MEHEIGDSETDDVECVNCDEEPCFARINLLLAAENFSVSLSCKIISAISALFPSLNNLKGWVQRYYRYELFKNVRPYILELWCILYSSFVRPGDLDLDLGPLPSKWLSRLYLTLAVYDFLK